MTELLPHDGYMQAVADALAEYGIKPSNWWTGVSDDGRDTAILEAVFQDWPDGVGADEWLHDVLLTWDPYEGWRLIERGGGRNIFGLSEDSLAYVDPRQVAADTKARLTHGMRGWMPGPICIDGPRWDTRATEAAVDAWGATAA
ncbi:hypothetical protein ACFXCZ_35405 [Streptomyces sp. NPDC059396]|uniref:hypothetical protein n=1 Tax=Streptomyces sp. NPDC059396 TaxID=3346819 RepID=UPI0036C99393